MSKPNLPNKNCKSCEVVFNPWKAAQKFCSRICYYDYGRREKRKKESWWVNVKGYIEGRVWIDENTQRRVLQHRWVMEKSLGRELEAHEDVHHLDGDKTNNDIRNLKILNHGKHSTLTNKERDYNSGYKMKLSNKERERRSRVLKEWHNKQALRKAGVEFKEAVER